MFSNAVKSALQPSVSERTLVMAAVSVRLAVVDVTNGADVNMRLSALKLLFGHKAPLEQVVPGRDFAFIP